MSNDHELWRALPDGLAKYRGQLAWCLNAQGADTLGVYPYRFFKRVFMGFVRCRARELDGNGFVGIRADEQPRCGIRDQSHRFDTIRDVRDLLLILPDLRCEPSRALLSDERFTAQWADMRWRVARPQALNASWRSRLTQVLGQPQLADCPVASLLEAARAKAAGAKPDPSPWVATPMHWLAGLTQVHAPLESVLQLPQAEADELALSFESTFAGSGLSLLPAGSVGFVLQGLSVDSVRVDEPANLRGHNLSEHQPQGAGAARLKALMSELEMWLHDHPLNRRREVRGEAGISSLWLWGGGAGAIPEPQVPTRTVQCFSDEAWVEAMCELMQLSHQSAPRDAQSLLSQPSIAIRPDGLWAVILTGWDLAAVQRDWLQPICEELTVGSWNSLTIETADHSLVLSGRDRWRFWRRPANPLVSLLTVAAIDAGEGR